MHYSHNVLMNNYYFQSASFFWSREANGNFYFKFWW